MLKGEMNVGFIVCYMSNVSDNAVTLNTIGLDKYHSEFSRVILMWLILNDLHSQYYSCTEKEIAEDITTFVSWK